MKTFTSFLMLVVPIAGVVIPGFAAAGIVFPLPVLIAVAAVLLAVFGYAHRTAASVDQVRTGSPFATNYRSAAPATVATMQPAAATVVPMPAQAAPAQRKTRRVSAIVEIAA